MLGVTLSAEEIKAAPSEVRRWLEHEIACTLGPRPATEGATHAQAPSSPGRDVKQSSKGSAGRTFAAEEGPVIKREVKMDTIDEPSKDEAIRKLIAVRAYELWENQG
ncbi:MAG: hypothetical protein P4L90_16250, partial [Rhodopila sp.]|nr:hypothetical protein [Rhodopila sp.]